MPEEVLFEQEQSLSRAEVASYLRTVADRLDDGSSITLTAGGQSIDLEVPARTTFEVKVERERPTGAQQGELSVEFELEWDEDGADGGELRIE